MSERVREQITIDASPDDVWSVLVDFPNYPAWAPDLKSIEVLDTDEEGRGLDVRFRAAAMGRSTSYTLHYDYSDPFRLAWKLTGGDITRKLDGHYELVPDGSGTCVTYELEAELVVPIPGFVKRRTQGRIMHSALHELKARVESFAR